MNILKRRPDYWLPAYAMNALERARARRARTSRLTHIMFLVCDHYEPQHDAKTPGQPAERVQTWLREYARFQARFVNAFGTSPLHTWFYPPHHGEEHLKALSQMVFDGLGEVELHYHHDGDTNGTFQISHPSEEREHQHCKNPNAHIGNLLSPTQNARKKEAPAKELTLREVLEKTAKNKVRLKDPGKFELLVVNGKFAVREKTTQRVVKGTAGCGTCPGGDCTGTSTGDCSGCGKKSGEDFCTVDPF